MNLNQLSAVLKYEEHQQHLLCTVIRKVNINFKFHNGVSWGGHGILLPAEQTGILYLFNYLRTSHIPVYRCGRKKNASPGWKPAEVFYFIAAY